jgi:hypothetical protein
MCKTKRLKIRITEISNAIKEQVAAFQDGKHPDLQMTARLAELHEATSELAEISTRRIVHLTWALVVLTGGLFIYTVFLYEDAKAKNEGSPKTEHHQFQTPESPKATP